MSRPVGLAPEFWIVRDCQGKVRRKFLGLIPFVRYEHNPDGEIDGE